jgi:hypothetical protein
LATLAAPQKHGCFVWTVSLFFPWAFMAAALKNKKEVFLGKAAGKSCWELATVAAPQKHGCWTVPLHWLPACIPPLHQHTNGLRWGCHERNFFNFPLS